MRNRGGSVFRGFLYALMFSLPFYGLVAILLLR